MRGVTLSFNETASGTTNLNNYASSWHCTADDEPLSSGTGTSGTVTIPTHGEVILCQIVNSPLVAQVNVSKYLLDAHGENPTAKAGWTVGATASATSGTVNKTPSATTLPTASDGSAAWTLRFNSTSARATVHVSEVQQTGYQFVSGSCVIVSLDGSVEEVTLTGEANMPLTGVAPGDEVTCEYLNRPLPTLTLKKQVQTPAAGTGYATPTDWTLTATQDGTNPTVVSGVTGTAGVTNTVVPLGDYTLTEAFTGASGTGSAYTLTSLECVSDADSSVVYTAPTSDGVVTSAVLPLDSGIGVTCTYTNTPKLGTVTWTKVDNHGEYLSGSEWSMQGPDAGGPTIAVVDCVEDNATLCALHDTDPAAGHFSIEDLGWGTYTLTETRAPGGFVLSTTEYTFTISGSSLSGEITEVHDNEIVNQPRDGLVIPLTGGLGRDFYQALGFGVLVLGAAAVTALMIRNRRKEVV